MRQPQEWLSRRGPTQGPTSFSNAPTLRPSGPRRENALSTSRMGRPEIRRRRIGPFVGGGLAIFGLWLCQTLSAQSTTGWIGFLKNGEVWTAASDGQGARRLTPTGEIVDDFRFAPGSDYLAYSRARGVLEGRTLTSIVVMNTRSGAIVAELQGTQTDPWVYLNRWLPGAKLLCHRSSGADVSGTFELDVVRHTTRELDVATGDRLNSVDEALDGTVTAYIDDIGSGYQRRLHVVDTRTGLDVVPVTMPAIYDLRLAPDARSVAFLQVRGFPPSMRDQVWIYRIDTRTLTERYEGPAGSKTSGEYGLSWSTDSRYLALGYGGEALILDLSTVDTPPQHVAAQDLCWAGPQQAVFADQRGIELYDVRTATRRLLLDRASHPECLVGRP